MTEGTICCGERYLGGTRSAIALAAARSISWVMWVARISMAPRKMPGRYNGCAGGPGCFRCNFWIGYGKHKENGAFRHGADHLWGDRVPRREPDDHVSATHGISECPRDVGSVRLTGDVHLRPVHIEEAVTIEDTQAITDQEVLKARVQQEVGDANATWTGAIDDDAHVLWLFVNQLERIVHSAKNGSGSRMLFGMQDGDVDGSRQVIGNGETAWRSDPTEADAAKGRPQRQTSTDDCLYILCVQRDGKGIHAPKGFEENAGVFEHGQGRQGADVA